MAQTPTSRVVGRKPRTQVKAAFTKTYNRHARARKEPNITDTMIGPLRTGTGSRMIPTNERSTKRNLFGARDTCATDPKPRYRSEHRGTAVRIEAAQRSTFASPTLEGIRLSCGITLLVAFLLLPVDIGT